MGSIIAKFVCDSVTQHKGGAEEVRLSAAHGPGNEEWSKFTPNGTLAISITNEAAKGRFSPGGEYMLTIEHAPAAQE